MATTSYASQQRPDFISRMLSRPLTINWYLVAWTVILVAAIITRFVMLGERAMSHDESLHTYYSWKLYTDGDFQHTPLMHGPVLFHMVALSYALFGVSDFSARIYPAVLGVLMVLFPLLFRRWLGRTGALLAGIGILISPILLFHHRYIREDIPNIFYTMVMVWCAFQYIDGPAGIRRKARWLYIFAGAMVLSLGSKETAFMYVAIFGLFMTLYWLARLYQHFARRPARTIFYHMIFPALLGGTISLFMFAVLSIALYTYSTLEGRVDYLISTILNIGTTTPSLEFSMALGWSLVLILALALLVIGTAAWAFRHSRTRIPWREIALMIALTLAVTTVLVVFEEVSKVPSRAEQLQQDPDYDIIDSVAESWTPMIINWVVCGAVVALLIVSKRRGWLTTMQRFAEFDILVLMGTLILPWLAALPIYLMGASPRDTSPDGVLRTVLSFAPLMSVSILFGVLWNWKRWLISAAIFYSLFVFFFTTMFTNPNGLVTGIIGSLGYWLDQQGVRRGGQPQYYYQLVIMPIYEYLPMIGSFLASIAGLVGFWAFRRERLTARRLRESTLADMVSSSPEPGEIVEIPGIDGETPAPAMETVEEMRRRELWGPNRLRRMPFTLFVAFWAIMIFLALTLAGEKMPWLGTHMTLPMILLTAWLFGRIFDRVEWSRFLQGGWMYLLLLPPLAIALFQVLSPFLFNQWSTLFTGLSQFEQQQRNLWIAVVAICALIIVLIWQLARRTTWRHFRSVFAMFFLGGLSLLTARAAWMASYINYDYAVEYMVYAHAGPGIKLMTSQIEEISRRTAGELNMRFAWGGNAWPVSWYFRDLTNAVFFGDNPTPDALRDAVAVYASEDVRARVEPLLGDNYYRFEYMRMWWPSWNYYNLSADRVANAWDFNATNTQAGQLRRGLFDIWLNRDFTAYGQATGESYSLTNWNPGEKLYFYVRKDIAQQIWNLGVGEGSSASTTTASNNQCVDNWQLLAAQRAFGTADSQPVGLNHPIDTVTGPDGSVYVADEFNNRVVRYDASGQYVGEITGAGGPLPLQRPNGLAMDAEGMLWVADTWNYRIARFDPNTGELLASWGQPGLYGDTAQSEPTDGLWGPRDIAVGPDGNIYVADTGNKRIRVYTPAGEWLRDIGSSGSQLGQLNEPAGIGFSSDRLYVADTWNRRISVFSLEGTPLYAFTVGGWFEDQGDRPFLDIDLGRGLVYVGDPPSGRVLVYDLQGACVGAFGQAADQPFDLTQLRSVGGIHVNPDGSVTVIDSGANRVLTFPAFPTGEASASAPVAQGGAVDAVQGAVVEEVTAEVIAGDQAAPAETAQVGS